MMSNQNNSATPAGTSNNDSHDQAEPVSDLWRCEHCGANTKLHFRRRDPGNCANCGARAWVAWHRGGAPSVGS